MSSLLSSLANQQTTLAVLLAAAGLCFAAALLLRWKPAASWRLPRPSRAVVAPILAVLAGLALAVFFVVRPPDLASLRRVTLPHWSPPSFAWPSWQHADKQRTALAALFCQLKLEEGAIAISDVDQCATEAEQQPDLAYHYITRGSLGAPWDQLSDNEKAIAVDKAKQTAAALSDILRLAHTLGVPATRLPDPPPGTINDLYLR